MSYSQGTEELEILKYYDDKPQGRFLDIGAWTGREFSNTRALAERGWSGLMVEPSPYCFHQLVENVHEFDGRVQCLCCAVLPAGSARRIIQFFETADAVGTDSVTHREKWEKESHGDEFQAGKYRKICVTAVTFSDLVAFGPFDFINIDTEGSSHAICGDVIEHARGAGWPSMICVEHDGHDIEIARRARGIGMSVKYLDGNNIIFGR